MQWGLKCSFHSNSYLSILIRLTLHFVSGQTNFAKSRMRKTFIFGLFGIILTLAGSVSAALPKIHVDPTKNGHFVDELGRVRIFRGVNSVTKGGRHIQDV